MSMTENLGNVIVVAPVIRIWSGQVTLRRNEDLCGASGLPPKGLVSDGAKRIIDPSGLTKLESQRRSVNRDLAVLGIRSPMGYILTPDQEDVMHASLAGRKAAFETYRDELVQNYDQLCAAWEAKHPGFEQLLRRNRPPVEDIAKAIDFDYALYKVAPVDSEKGKSQFEAIAKATASALINDVASSAASILKDSFKGRERITQRTVGVVRALVQKLRSFVMFDPRIVPTANALESILDSLPKTGPLDATQTLILGAMLRSISDPDQVVAAGNRSNIADVDDEPEDEEKGAAESAAQQHTTAVAVF